MSEDNFMQNEELKIIIEKKKYENDRGYKAYVDSYNIKKSIWSLLMLIFICVGSVCCANVYVECPECNHMIDINKEAGIFPDTWTCPNKDCRYKNYEGIEYCALCGSRRPR